MVGVCFGMLALWKVLRKLVRRGDIGIWLLVCRDVGEKVGRVAGGWVLLCFVDACLGLEWWQVGWLRIGCLGQGGMDGFGLQKTILLVCRLKDAPLDLDRHGHVYSCMVLMWF